MKTRASLVAVARRLGFIREVGGANAGAWVNFMQRFCDGKIGDSWCADLVSLVLNIAYYGKPPVIRTGSTVALLADCRKKGYVIDGPPLPEDLCFSVHEDGTPHHVAIVTVGAPLTTFAGNTSQDGLSSNGDGAYEHPVHGRFTFARLPEALP